MGFVKWLGRRESNQFQAGLEALPAGCIVKVMDESRQHVPNDYRRIFPTVSLLFNFLAKKSRHSGLQKIPFNEQALF